MSPNDKQQETIDKYNAFVERYPHKTRTEIVNSLGIGLGTLKTYEANGWIKLPPVLSKEEARRKVRESCGQINLKSKYRRF